MSSHARTVLLVDDCSVLRHAVRRLFEEEGFRVIGEAEDGSSGVELAIERKPDLVVLDLSMPNMNGLQAAASLLKALPQTVVVLFTAHADNKVLQKKASAVGIRCVLPKSDYVALLDQAETLTRHLA